MKIWLDDEREMPDGYDIHCKTVEECIDKIKLGDVECISLDNDLGLWQKEGRELAKFIERETLTGNLYYIKLKIHTQNPVARKEMITILQNIAKYWMKNEKSEN